MKKSFEEREKLILSLFSDKHYVPMKEKDLAILLQVPRQFKRADYLPCILWGRLAQEGSQCHIRDGIRISGRLQSRNYTKVTEEGPEERTAYEISALTAEFPEL